MFDSLLQATEIGMRRGKYIRRLDGKLRFRNICIPIGFQTDLDSVPRVPIIFWLWGDRAHREAVLHDYLYRINSRPVVTRWMADSYFREAIIVTQMEKDPESWIRTQFVAWGMWLGVRIGGWSSYHKMRVEDELIPYIDPVQ